MRVSRAKAEENRAKVVEVAGRLFRTHGFDGIGLSDLMKGAGLTQGGFYKQFRSKDDLIVEASSVALEKNTSQWNDLINNAAGEPLKAIVDFYLSAFHRGEVAEGCAIAALGADAARHSAELRETFEVGIGRQLSILDAVVDPALGQEQRDTSIATLATMVGALVLARCVEDQGLSERILRVATDALLKKEHGSAERDRPT